MPVFVCRNAFGRTRNRSPQSSSSIASSPQISSAGQVRHLGGRVVHGPVHRAHLREGAQAVDEVVAEAELARRGDDLDERLAGVAALAHHQVAKEPLLRLLAEGLEPVCARPLDRGGADRVAEVGRQPAAVDLEHLVPAARPMEAERGAAGRGRERVVEPVPVVEDLLGRKQRLERRLRNPADPPQRLAHLVRLGRGLHLVAQVLKAAAAARGEVVAGRLDAVGARLDDLERGRLRVAPLHLRHAREHGVAGQPAAHEDDEPVQPRDAVAAVGERVDAELELLPLGDGNGHGDEPSRRLR